MLRDAIQGGVWNSARGWPRPPNASASDTKGIGLAGSRPRENESHVEQNFRSNQSAGTGTNYCSFTPPACGVVLYAVSHGPCWPLLWLLKEKGGCHLLRQNQSPLSVCGKTGPVVFWGSDVCCVLARDSALDCVRKGWGIRLVEKPGSLSLFKLFITHTARAE